MLNETLVNRDAIRCLECNEFLPPENERWIGNSNPDPGICGYGIQNYTCCECLKHYCNDCHVNENENENDRASMLNYCELSERKVCYDCQQSKRCSGCEKFMCVSCPDFDECHNCDNFNLCKHCIEMGQGNWGSSCFKCETHFCDNCRWRLPYRCGSCNKTYCIDCDAHPWPCCDCDSQFCDDCNEHQGIHAVRVCKSCNFAFCGECLGESINIISTSTCGFCIEKLEIENKKLKEQVKFMQDHNDFFQEQLQCQKDRVKELEEKLNEMSRSRSGKDQDD